jgi:hypothetical protein
MKVHTTNYQNTFIECAEDCPTMVGEVPPEKPGQKSVASIQFELLSKHPYRYTSDEVLFFIYAERNQLLPTQYEGERKLFFSKGQPCLRCSPLAKRYGWGIHFDAAGKVALYGRETKNYQLFLKDEQIKHRKAMRTNK